MTFIKNRLLPILSTFKYYLLVVSKIFFVLISLYYLVHFNEYSIGFNLPIWIRNFYIINQTVTYIENIGLLLIIIPLAVVIMSFYDDSRILKFFSGMFSLGGTFFAFVHTTSIALLEEKFRAGLITIFHQAKFTDKIAIFQAVFDGKINELILNGTAIKIEPAGFSTDLAQSKIFIQTVIDKNWSNYIDQLKNIPINNVEEYANKLAINAYNQYIDHKKDISSTSSSWYDGAVNFFYTHGPEVNLKNVAISIVVTLGVTWLIKKLREAGVLIRDTAKNQHEISQIQTENLENNGEVMKEMKKIADNQDTLSTVLEDLYKRLGKVELANNKNIKLLEAQILSLKENRLAKNLSIEEISGDKGLDLRQQIKELTLLVLERNKLVDNQLNSLSSKIESDKLNIIVDNLSNRLEKLTVNITQIEGNIGPFMEGNSSISEAGVAAERRLLLEAVNKIQSFDKQQIISEVKTELNNKIIQSQQVNKEELTETVKTLIQSNTVPFKKQINSKMQENNANFNHLAQQVEDLKEDQKNFKSSILEKFASFQTSFEDFKTIILTQIQNSVKKTQYINPVINMIKGINQDNRKIDQQNNDNISTTTTTTTEHPPTNSNTVSSYMLNMLDDPEYGGDLTQAYREYYKITGSKGSDLSEDSEPDDNIF